MRFPGAAKREPLISKPHASKRPIMYSRKPSRQDTRSYRVLLLTCCWLLRVSLCLSWTGSEGPESNQGNEARPAAFRRLLDDSSSGCISCRVHSLVKITRIQISAIHSASEESSIHLALRLLHIRIPKILEVILELCRVFGRNLDAGEDFTDICAMDPGQLLQGSWCTETNLRHGCGSGTERCSIHCGGPSGTSSARQAARETLSDRMSVETHKSGLGQKYHTYRI